MKDLTIYGILPFYCPQIVHKQPTICFQMHFLFTLTKQISCLLCPSRYLLLVMHSSDVIFFPEGTLRLKISIKSLQLLFIDGNGYYCPQAAMMDSHFSRELTTKWMITALHSVTVLPQPFTVPISIPASALALWCTGRKRQNTRGTECRSVGGKTMIKEQWWELAAHFDGHRWSGRSSVLHLTFEK